MNFRKDVVKEIDKMKKSVVDNVVFGLIEAALKYNEILDSLHVSCVTTDALLEMYYVFSKCDVIITFLGMEFIRYEDIGMEKLSLELCATILDKVDIVTEEVKRRCELGKPSCST